MSEIAVISARKSRLTADAKKGDRAAERALSLAEEPDKFLSTVQIGITLVGILTGIYSGASIADSLTGIVAGWGVSQSIARLLAQAAIVVIVTYLTILFGELVPKRIGMALAESAAKSIARPMGWLSRLCAPFVWILSKSTAAMVSLLGLKDHEAIVTEDEIRSIVQEGKDDGTVQDVEQDIVERVFMLGDLSVSSLMTYRSDVVAIDIDSDAATVMQVLSENLFETYPIMRGSMDDIEGSVSLKSLALNINKPNFSLAEIMEKPNYFPEGMSVYKALEQMREKRFSHAFICDEFGVFQGIITLRDILEGLVGEISEKNETPDIVKREGADGWLVDGQCAFHDFLAYFDRSELCQSDAEYRTVAGLVLKELDHIPQTGESLTWNDFHIEIVDMDGARIDKLLVMYDKPVD